MNGDTKLIISKIKGLEKKFDNFYDENREAHGKMFDKINKHATEIAKCEIEMKNHKESHKTGRSWTQWIPTLLSLFIAVVAVIVALN